MPDQYPHELKEAMSKLEAMILEFRRKNHTSPMTLMINHDEEEQSWLMWAAQLLGISYELTTKSKTRVV